LRSAVALGAITIVCAAVPLWNLAHGAADALPPFWTGVRQLAGAPLPLIASLGLGVTVAFSSLGAVAILTAGLTAFLVAGVDPALLAGAPSLAVIAMTGLVSISGWSPPGWLALLFGLASGAVAATAAKAHMPQWDVALGLGTMVIVIAGWIVRLLLWARSLPPLREAAPVARQVIGAWGTAIAILLAMSR
jgi:hypothetical protein